MASKSGLRRFPPFPFLLKESGEEQPKSITTKMGKGIGVLPELL